MMMSLVFDTSNCSGVSTLGICFFSGAVSLSITFTRSSASSGIEMSLSVSADPLGDSFELTGPFKSWVGLSDSFSSTSPSSLSGSPPSSSFAPFSSGSCGGIAGCSWGF
uniref:Uncharacterized protein n=1 Tax=Anopheles atroparvus TaxID=41427 RepID=A0AAG5CQJ9_ANOAO